MLDTVRAFIAVNLEVSTIRRAAALAKTLRSHPDAAGPSIAWVAAPNLHIKLRDLGEMDRSLSPALGDALREQVTATAPFRLSLGAVIAAPSPEQARLILLDVHDPSGSVHALALRVGQLLTSLGFAPPRCAFRPHLMLARLREPRDVSSWLAAVDGPPVGETRVTECALYDANLPHPNTEYEALQRAAFAPPTPARSQRPRTRAPSQRPKARSRAPEARAADPASPSIPPPPRLPSFVPSAAAPGPADPVQTAPPASTPGASQKAPRGSLPPAVEAALPPDEDWGD